MSKPQIDEMRDVEQADTAISETETLDLSVGERLLRAREARQLELRDVAEKTRQSQDTLSALERMDTDHIPDSILRLQAKNYARFLGLPESEIAAGYAEARGFVDASAMPAESTRSSGVSQKTMLIGAGAVVLATLLIGGLSLVLRAPSPETSDPLAISARLAPVYADVEEIQSLAAATSEEFSIRANKRAWIEVRGSDGTVFRNRDMSPGEVYYPRTGAGWTITVRDAGAFAWGFGEDAVTPIGEAEQALYSISIDAARDAAIAARSASLAEFQVNLDLHANKKPRRSAVFLLDIKRRD